MSSKLKIAFPTSDGVTVDAHFGHCSQFLLVDVQDGAEVSRSSVEPPAHAPGVFPAFLAQQGATAIICGGMGGRAVSLFKEQNIDVILGATGAIAENLSTFLEGDLASSDSVCHAHEGGCH